MTRDNGEAQFVNIYVNILKNVQLRNHIKLERNYIEHSKEKHLLLGLTFGSCLASVLRGSFENGLHFKIQFVLLLSCMHMSECLIGCHSINQVEDGLRGGNRGLDRRVGFWIGACVQSGCCGRPAMFAYVAA